MDARSLLAAAIGVLLGAALVAFPDAVVRAKTAGRLPRDRGGAYGTDGDLPGRWRLVVRAVGVLLVVAGLYFGVTAVP